jgi:hypothetical protein
MQYQTINHAITWHFILACDVYGTIGDGLRMPWDSLDGDLKRFKELTTGKAVVMGRNTFESMPFFPKGLPNRRNYILSIKYAWPSTVMLQAMAMQGHTKGLEEFALATAVVHNSFFRVSALVDQIASDVVDGKIPTDVWIIGGPAVWRQLATMENTGVRIHRGMGTDSPTVHQVTFKGVEEVHLSLVTVPQKGSVTYPEALDYLLKAVRGDGWEVMSKLPQVSFEPNSPSYNYYHLKRKPEELLDESAKDLT